MTRILTLMEQAGARVTLVGLIWVAGLYTVPHWLPAPLLSLERAILAALCGLFLISLSKALQPDAPAEDAPQPESEPQDEVMERRLQRMLAQFDRTLTENPT